MIPVQTKPQMATAYQYLPETAAGMNGLQLPSGPVTVQLADEMNRIEGRCYVPTSWGTAILSPGDWIVAYEVGIVVAVTAEQFPHLFELRTEGMLDIPELGTPVESKEVTLEMELQAVGEQQLRMSAEPLGPRPVLRIRATEDSGSWLPSFEAYCNRNRLDYSLHNVSENRDISADFRIVLNATGREVVQFRMGDLLDCYADGRIERVLEASER